MEGLRNNPGFLGTGAHLLADITLIVEILFYVVLCLGVTAQLWRKYKWHNRLQTPVVLLNLFFIGLVMIPTFLTVIAGGIEQMPGVVLIHAGIGTLAEIVAIYCLLAGFKILPRRIGLLRYLMWTAFVLWTLTVLFGVAMYLSFYTGALAGSGHVTHWG